MDAVLATTSYADAHAVEESLITAGFRQDLADTRHAHRWRSPEGIPFDLVPAGQHLGASGSPWDQAAIDTAATATIDPGITIRHASAPAFLALKWAAHHDRGADDPLGSHDLEDILALLASRPVIVDEVAAAPLELRLYVAAQTKAFLAGSSAEDLLAAHLNHSQDPAHTITAVRTQLEHLAQQ
ncbi:MAG: hypothetical protein ACREMF_03335 [Gemmatimonadales bacterium]